MPTLPDRNSLDGVLLAASRAYAAFKTSGMLSMACLAYVSAVTNSCVNSLWVCTSVRRPCSRSGELQFLFTGHVPGAEVFFCVQALAGTTPRRSCWSLPASGLPLQHPCRAEATASRRTRSPPCTTSTRWRRSTARAPWRLPSGRPPCCLLPPASACRCSWTRLVSCPHHLGMPAFRRSIVRCSMRARG